MNHHQRAVLKILLGVWLGSAAGNLSAAFQQDCTLCSATIRTPGRVASIKNVTELLIVVGGRLQGLSDILRRQLVRLDTVW
jgi:hypothetical protein